MTQLETNISTPNPEQNSFSLFRRFVKVVANLKLAIVLLLVIALFSILGTVIEQGKSLVFYQQNYPEDPALFGFLSWKVLLNLGLNHVYSTWWYLSLLVLFGTSLAACTFVRQLPALKAARRWKFYEKPKQFRKFALSTQLNQVSTDSLVDLLEQRNYKVFQEGNSIYARKGLIGKIGPIVVHAAILIVLAGGIWGALTGFFAQELIASGNTFTVKNIIEAGPFSSSHIPQDWGVKVNRFWIDYTADGNIDQFYSDLSVVDTEGNELDHKTISVNHPLRYDGVTFYQTDWGIAGIKIRVNNSPVLQVPMTLLDTGGAGRLWGTFIPTKPDLSEGFPLVTKDMQGTVLVYDTAGNLASAMRVGQTMRINGVTFKLVDLVGSTGLQIKADPGVPIVYVGFGLLMISVMMSYFSHSQIWALQEGDSLYVGGRTNRAQVTFEREIVQMLEVLQEEEQTSQRSQVMSNK